MSAQTPYSLGILHLERGVPSGAAPPKPPPGSMLNPETFDFPVISETVAGAWVENVVRGDPALEPAFIAAARRLVERGAVAISSTCGFSIRHQRALSASVEVPVAMSSLLLLPLLVRQLPPKAKIAVLTYDSTHFGEDLFGLDDPADRARVVVGGIEGGKFWHDELKRPAPPIDVAAIETDVATCIARLRVAHPEIAAILFECAAFPMVAAAIRRMAKLPVYDITDLCRMTMASTGRRQDSDNRRVSLTRENRGT
ncbi:hypothetical protein GWE18_40065 [Bradyrhizobium sp. CSA112]|uniref:hypothetical protein n=1 Tax=Bradyrhizobium sp. CSA112 TaxID=2699170 RepID=UPI0023B1C20B|nr:hypothetical protein [Bradyrhizobium sp. CSA112]MDE5458825.1 hypothetical protein [Bradyrhizobium sp. CSA112]